MSTLQRFASDGSHVFKPPNEKGAFGVGRCEVRRPSVTQRGVADSPQTSEQVGPSGVEQVVVLEIELVEQSQGGRRTPDFAEGDGAVQRDGPLK